MQVFRGFRHSCRNSTGQGISAVALGSLFSSLLGAGGMPVFSLRFAPAPCEANFRTKLLPAVLRDKPLVSLTVGIRADAQAVNDHIKLNLKKVSQVADLDVDDAPALKR